MADKTERVDDGGSAFPVPIKKNQFDTTPQDFFDTGMEGMSLRDWFAGQALLGLTACSGYPQTESDRANDAYCLAEAMIARRKRRGAR